MRMSSELGPWHIDYHTNHSFGLSLTLLQSVRASTKNPFGLGKLMTIGQLLAMRRQVSSCLWQGARVRRSSSRQMSRPRETRRCRVGRQDPATPGNAVRPDGHRVTTQAKLCGHPVTRSRSGPSTASRRGRDLHRAFAARPSAAAVLRHFPADRGRVPTGPSTGFGP